MSLAVVIITYNEERNIAAAIDSARQVTDEIIVIDSGSADRTADIAAQAGAKVFIRVWNDDFAAQRNFAADKTAADWLFHLDADERVSPELAKNIKQAVAKEQKSVFSQRRVNYVLGKIMRFGAMRPDTVTRLYPRGAAFWQGALHEKLVSELPRAGLSGPLYHHTYDNWELFFNKVNKYTTIWAETARAKGKKTSLAAAVGHGLFAFGKGYLLQLGFLGGWPGFIVCYMHALYTMAKYLKLWQLQAKG
jgi:glycosyltransferase involved in cell wall biosynthesis